MSIDVIIPHYNQTFALHMTLDGFAKQLSEEKIHIIIIDDGSTELVDQFDWSPTNER